MKTKAFLFIVVLLLVTGSVRYFDAVVQPTVAPEMAVAQLDDSDSAGVAMRSYDALQRAIPATAVCVLITTGWRLFRGTGSSKNLVVRE